MTPAEARKLVRKQKASILEDTFARQLRGLPGAPTPVREFAFAPGRAWRFDFAWPELWLAVEIDGGEWSGGAHSRGFGMNNDREKRAVALLLGWRVLVVTGTQVRNGQAFGWAEQLLRQTPAHLTGTKEQREKFLRASDQLELGGQ